MKRKARSIFNRVGGKARLVPTILRNLPPHRCFTETFGGSAIVTLCKDPVCREVINDLDAGIANVFRVVRDQPQSLARQLALTLYSRREFDEAYAFIRSGSIEDIDPVEWARRLIVVHRQGYYGTPPLTWSYSRVSSTRLKAWHRLPRLVMELTTRLKNVGIESQDYADCLKQHDGPEYCHYLDPPYHGVESKYYPVNRGEGFDHERLRNVIEDLRGSVVVSYYERDEILRLYRGFRCIRIPVKTTINTKKGEVELLLIRPSGYASGRHAAIVDIFEDDLVGSGAR